MQPVTNRSKRAVLSDVDGTLIDSNYFHTLSWWQALRQSGITTPTAAIHPAVGMGGQELLHYLLGSNTPLNRLMPWSKHTTPCFQRTGPHWFSLTPPRSCSNTTPPRGAAVVLASSAQETELNALRKALDAESAITAATSSSDAGRGKPSPDIRDAVWDAETPGAAEVFRDVRELLGNVDNRALGKLFQPETRLPRHDSGANHNTSKHTSNHNKEAHMQANNESGKQQVQRQEHAREENLAGKKSGGKDPNGLPDGSGTTREGHGSEPGQEDGGASFDAG